MPKALCSCVLCTVYYVLLCTGELRGGVVPEALCTCVMCTVYYVLLCTHEQREV